MSDEEKKDCENSLEEQFKVDEEFAENLNAIFDPEEGDKD